MRNPPFNPPPYQEATIINLDERRSAHNSSWQRSLPLASGDDAQEHSTDHHRLHIVEENAGPQIGGTAEFHAAKEEATLRHPLTPLADVLQLEPHKGFFEKFRDGLGAGKDRRRSQIDAFLPLIGVDRQSPEGVHFSYDLKKATSTAVNNIIDLFDIYDESVFEKPRSYTALHNFAQARIALDCQENPERNYAYAVLQQISQKGRSYKDAASFVAMAWSAYVDQDGTTEALWQSIEPTTK